MSLVSLIKGRRGESGFGYASTAGAPCERAYATAQDLRAHPASVAGRILRLVAERVIEVCFHVRVAFPC